MPKKRRILTAALSVAAVAALSCAAVFTVGKMGIMNKPQPVVSVSDEPEAEPADAMDQQYYAAERDVTFTGSFRTMLVGDELMVYDAMKQHFVVERRNDPLTVSFPGKGYQNIDTVRDILYNAYDCFMNDYPEVYWVNYFQRTVTRNDQNLIDTATMDFRKQAPDLYDQAEKLFSNIDLAVERIKKSRRSESRYDTVRTAHDYICWNASYDWGIVNHDELRNFTYLAAPLFGVGNRGHRFVCSGYAEAFCVLCNRLDVPCMYVEGNYDFGAHAWNYVQMEDGQWYGMDVTWDDDDAGGPPRHTYFLTGNNSRGTDGKTYAEMHVPADSIESGGVLFYIKDEPIYKVYPTLSDTMYERG